MSQKPVKVINGLIKGRKWINPQASSSGIIPNVGTASASHDQQRKLGQFFLLLSVTNSNSSRKRKLTTRISKRIGRAKTDRQKTVQMTSVRSGIFVKDEGSMNQKGSSSRNRTPVNSPSSMACLMTPRTANTSLSVTAS